MALTTTDFNVSFLLGGSSKVFKFTDITDYASQSGVASTAITGRIKVTAPSGIISYNNLGGSADITGSNIGNSRVNTTTISVPLLSNGKPEVGVYTFEYRATEGTNPASDPTVAKIKTFNYSYTKPKATNQLTSDCLSPELKGSDTTNYLVNGVTPNDSFLITGVSTANNTFSVSGDKVGFFTVGNKFDVIGSTGNNGQYTITNVNYDQSSNKTIVSVSSVISSALNGSIVQRRTTLYFTSVPGVEPLVGYNPILTTNSFYSQLQSFSFEAHVLYDFGGGFSVSDTFVSSDSISVDCEKNLCDVFCSINSVFGEYMKYKGVNKTLADLALDRYIIITSHLASLRTAYECGDSVAITKLTDQIKDVAQSNDDCDCTTGDPILITGTGGSSGGGNIYNVVSAGNGLNVSTSVSGSTTTYTLSLTASILTDIANATATSSVISSDSSITVTSSASTSTNTQYDIKIPPATPIVPPKEFMVMKLEIENPNNTVSFTPKDVSLQNQTNLKNPTVAAQAWTYAEFLSAGAAGSTYTGVYAINISGFQTSPNSTYKVDVSSYFQEYEVNVPGGGGGTFGSNIIRYQDKILEPRIVETGSGSFRLYFEKTWTGGYAIASDMRNIMSLTAQKGYTKIYLTIKIYE